MSDGCVVGAHTLGRLRFNADSRRLNAQQPGDILLDRHGMWPDLRRGQNQSSVNVSHHISSCFHLRHRLAHKHGRVSAFPLRIARREICADVSCGDGPQQRVGQSVEQHISVGMTGKPAIMRNQDAADFQRDAGPELV
jgi:hypothetical protein